MITRDTPIHEALELVAEVAKENNLKTSNAIDFIKAVEIYNKLNK